MRIPIYILMAIVTSWLIGIVSLLCYLMLTGAAAYGFIR